MTTHLPVRCPDCGSDAITVYEQAPIISHAGRIYADVGECECGAWVLWDGRTATLTTRADVERRAAEDSERVKGEG